MVGESGEPWTPLTSPVVGALSYHREARAAARLLFAGASLWSGR